MRAGACGRTPLAKTVSAAKSSFQLVDPDLGRHQRAEPVAQLLALELGQVEGRPGRCGRALGWPRSARRSRCTGCPCCWSRTRSRGPAGSRPRSRRWRTRCERPASRARPGCRSRRPGRAPASARRPARRRSAGPEPAAVAGDGVPATISALASATGSNPGRAAGTGAWPKRRSATGALAPAAAGWAGGGPASALAPSAAAVPPRKGPRRIIGAVFAEPGTASSAGPPRRRGFDGDPLDRVNSVVGRAVAQWESTTLTLWGSEVQSFSRPPRPEAPQVTAALLPPCLQYATPSR